MGSAASPAVDEVVAAASGLVGEPLALDADLSFSPRAVVARLTRPDGSTLIAKRPGDELALRRELAAYSALPPDTHADLVAHGRGLLVIDDLGTGPSLADLLLGMDADAALAGVLAWARAWGAWPPPPRSGAGGRRPVPAAGRHRRRARSGAGRGTGPPSPSHRRRDALDHGPPRPAGAAHGTDADRRLPDNNRITDGNARFFDFEFSSWHHVGFDVSFCRLPFSTCWCVGALPPGIGERMEAALVAELGDVDTRELGRATVMAGAWFVLDAIASLWKRADDHLRRTPGPTNGRERTRLHLTWLAAQADTLPCLRGAGRSVRCRLRHASARSRRRRSTPRSAER